jgi:hypothetical protein
MQKSQVACVLTSVTPGGRGNGTAIARQLPAQKNVFETKIVCGGSLI